MSLKLYCCICYHGNIVKNLLRSNILLIPRITIRLITIRHRLQGRGLRKAAHTHRQCVSVAQEVHLASWILAQLALGLAPTHHQLREFIQCIDNQGWYRVAETLSQKAEHAWNATQRRERFRKFEISTPWEFQTGNGHLSSHSLRLQATESPSHLTVSPSCQLIRDYPDKYDIP
jgi:hypothetical protein